ncbi:helix-turn-helix domain-containing protein [Streptomyces sp. NPDC097619]|uniref:IclR family transcriptional regulator n=1 Tax=Streptomyces sp. NPDC097619 TaxID=3157228 RepID=UPI00331C4D6B
MTVRRGRGAAGAEPAREQDAAGGTARGRGVLEGAFALLEALRRQGDEAGVTELALACGVPKATVHRLLEQLCALGAVERHGSRYRVGAGLYRLGQAWQPHPGLRAAARLPLHRLRAVTGASVVLTVLHEERALTVSSVPGEAEATVPVRNGLGFPLGTAAGLAVRGPLRPGPVLDREAVLPGVSCVALPVRAPDGRTVAALAAVVPAHRPLEPVARAAAEAGAAVSRGLRYAPPFPEDLPPDLLS